MYEADVSHEVVCFRNAVKDEIKFRKISKIRELAEHLLIENKLIACSIPYIHVQPF